MSNIQLAQQTKATEKNALISDYIRHSFDKKINLQISSEK